MEMQNVVHGHLIVSTINEKGWRHELFPVTGARREGPGWAWDTKGDSLGSFPDMAKAIEAAKKRNPPEPMPQVESVTVIEEKEGE